MKETTWFTKTYTFWFHRIIFLIFHNLNATSFWAAFKVSSQGVSLQFGTTFQSIQNVKQLKYWLFLAYLKRKRSLSYLTVWFLVAFIQNNFVHNTLRAEGYRSITRKRGSLFSKHSSTANDQDKRFSRPVPLKIALVLCSVTSILALETAFLLISVFVVRNSLSLAAVSYYGS